MKIGITVHSETIEIREMGIYCTTLEKEFKIKL